MRERGLLTDRKYLFVIDGAKALRSGVEQVFGSDQPVQRCRSHKMRLSDADDGIQRLEQLARFLEHDHESAAISGRSPSRSDATRNQTPPP